MNKKTVKDIEVKGKKVLVRCDFNVPMKDGVITDENRIIGALPTIKYLMEQGAKVVLCSHMGKPHNVFDAKLELNKKEKGKVLLVKFGGHFFNKEPLNAAFEFIEKEFETQGWEVTSLFFAKHRHLKEIMDDYDLVMVVCESNVHGSTLRIGWDNMMALWRGYILQHKNLVFVGMDDPYKLYDFPYAKTYVNLFGKAPCLQRSLVKLVLGKIESVGKNPISFEGYFERED